MRWGVTCDVGNVTLLEEGARSRLVGPLVPIGLALLLGVFWFAVHNPINFIPHSDSSVYLYIGQHLLKGAVPYRDTFDNKGPLLYLVNALGLTLGAGSFWGVYVLEYSLLALSTGVQLQLQLQLPLPQWGTLDSCSTLQLCEVRPTP